MSFPREDAPLVASPSRRCCVPLLRLVASLLRLAVDRFCRPAQRIYAGHGNVIQRPEAFRLNFDGHRLATSHVEFDFAGVSLVQAVDLPPEALVVEPDAHHYSLHTAHDATFTFTAAAVV